MMPAHLARQSLLFALFACAAVVAASGATVK